MKLWSNYCKEMKIASRGFYFYMEFFVAVIILLVLLFVVPTEANSISEEIVFADITSEQLTALMEIDTDEGYTVQEADAIFKVKPAVLTYTDMETGEETTLSFTDTKEVSVLHYAVYDPETDTQISSKYFVDNFEDLLRISYAEKLIAATMYYDEDGLDYYQYVLFGYETVRYQNLLSAIHGSVETEALLAALDDAQAATTTLAEIEQLNNRQNYIPPMLVMMNAMMGMMIIIAYLSVDKAEGVMRALSVSPIGLSNYLASKTLVVMTTVILSNSIIALPIMGSQPNYPLFYLVSIAMCALSCTIGMLLSTFFADLEGAFNAILIFCIAMLLPMITYLFPAFHPAWMNWLPTYPMLMAMQESLLSAPDVGYVLLCSAGMLALSAVLYGISLWRFRKTLTI
ncbi:MAG: ABC transporter permease [Faecalibacterium sp.]